MNTTPSRRRTVTVAAIVLVLSFPLAACQGSAASLGAPTPAPTPVTRIVVGPPVQFGTADYLERNGAGRPMRQFPPCLASVLIERSDDSISHVICVQWGG